MNIYKPQIVIALEEFYGDLLFAFDKFPNLVDHLAALANRLYEGIEAKHEPLYKELNNYHKASIGKSVEELKMTEITLLDCHDAIAQEYGFDNWETLSIKSDLHYNPPFEQAVNYLLAGHKHKLETLLTNHPSLIHTRSSYGHQATLLHYAGSNGVEFWRQKVPLNLYDMTEMLLQFGADTHATMSVYGGHFTTLELLTTSAHPYEAGVADKLVKLLT